MAAPAGSLAAEQFGEEALHAVPGTSVRGRIVCQAVDAGTVRACQILELLGHHVSRLQIRGHQYVGDTRHLGNDLLGPRRL